jgi:hypothetical protein
VALTTRKNILDTLLAKLLLVRTTNGYNSTINAVDRQRDTESDPFSPSECWAANVRDGRVEVEHDVSDDQHRLPVTIELHGTSRITLSAAEQALADVVDVILDNDSWGGYADGTTLESHEVDISQTGDVITAVQVDITIHYTTERGKV